LVQTLDNVLVVHVDLSVPGKDREGSVVALVRAGSAGNLDSVDSLGSVGNLDILDNWDNQERG